MKGLYTLASLLAAATAIPTGEPPTYGSNTTQPGWSVDKFKNFITFGDSYTDENRLGYFASHNGSAPPTGTILPESFNSADGGRVWARYVVQYTEQSLSLYNYAVSGAVCSNNITPRLFETINAPFPDLEGYEIPAFLADKAQNVNIDTGGPFFTTPLTDENAVYAFFDGTNDIGIEAFFTDSQVDGKVLSDYVDCIYNQMDRIYASGGRYFVVFNLTPLELLSLYANESAGGTGSDRYWNPKPTNLTEISDRMREFTTTLNSVFEYRTPYEVLVKNRYPGAHFASFDVNKIVSYERRRRCGLSLDEQKD